MLARLIQQKVPLGSYVKVSLKTGKEISGTLTEIGKEHITVEAVKGTVTILTESIGLWENLGDRGTESNEGKQSHETEETSKVKLKHADASSPQKKVIGGQITNGDLESEDAKPDMPEENLEKDKVSEAPEKQVSSPTDSLSSKAIKALGEIQDRFDAQTQSANLELRQPDFTFPADELTGWQNTTVAGEWQRIKNKYEYAKKINELSSKFGRIQPIVSELDSLAGRFPDSIALKRIIAFFSSILGNWDKALEGYQESAVQSGETNDWFDVAVSALKMNKEELACYGFEKFFYGGSISDEPRAWYVYVNLLQKFNNIPAFRELCKADKYDIEENGIEVLLDTAIYVLGKKGAEELATEIMQKRLAGESVKTLLGVACQRLDGQPVKSYHHFFTEFMNKVVASETKPLSKTPETPDDINTEKQPYQPTALPKQKSQTLLVPRGDDPYSRAKRADIREKDLAKAERLFREAIGQNVRPESATKDLAMVLVRLRRPEEAVKLLEDYRQRVEDKQSWNSLLITVYQNSGQYEKMIPLLNDILYQVGNQESKPHQRARNKERKSLVHWQIANTYIKLEDYLNAETHLRKLRPDNVPVQRSLGFCLSKQERYDEAEQILKRIQNISHNPKTAALLEAIERARTTGEFILDDDSVIEIENALLYYSGELSEFAQFFLERCAFDGVSPERVNDGKYTGSGKNSRYDIGRLEQIARRVGTRSPRERSHFYLSAARIYFDLGGNQNLFYLYLCRSFASRGDASVSENKHLDTVRVWYCEALSIYDGDRSRHKDEQDAASSLVRYLYSTCGLDHIRLTPNTPPIEKAVRYVIDNNPDREKVFNVITYLILHSRYAANKLLSRLYSNETLRKMALDYLKRRGIDIPNRVEHLDDFAHLWNKLRDEEFNWGRTISNKFGVLYNFELTTTWLEDNIRLAEEIRPNLLFKLDQQRAGELQRILEIALELCKQVTFEERERLCIQLRLYCQDLVGEIEESPTKLSIKDIYPIIEVIREKVGAYLERLYETLKPQLTLRLPVESYVPDTERKIRVQVVIENERGRSPAESLELIVSDDATFFEVTESDIKQNESLRGGEQAILTVSLRVTPRALDAQTFSFPVSAQYRTRTEEQAQTPFQNLSIRLYSEDEFEDIENPYAEYAEGGIVGDANMFFGREELIHNIANAIRKSRLQSKSVMVFGQKRSGKSSVLFHLKKLLQEDKDLLILNLDNIATVLGKDSHQAKDSKVTLLCQILKSILTELDYAIEDRVDEGFTALDLSIPSDQEFYAHPNPLQYFGDILKSFKRQVSQLEEWRDVRVVLLIDEFQYIYARIVAGEIPASFMEYWKALLQANYFNAVLVGQDVMPKFKTRFPNEFGTTQDERVTYLKPEDARRLIDEPIRIVGQQDGGRYREQAIERILDLTAGSPFYIQIICNRLVEYMNIKHAGLVTEADVEQVKTELIRGVNALGLDKFDNLINSGDTSIDAISDEDALIILKAIADNSSRTDLCPRDRIVCETISPTDTILDDLEKREVVERREQSYQIRVGLFKEWLVDNG